MVRGMIATVMAKPARAGHRVNTRTSIDITMIIWGRKGRRGEGGGEGFRRGEGAGKRGKRGLTGKSEVEEGEEGGRGMMATVMARPARAGHSVYICTNIDITMMIWGWKGRGERGQWEGG